VVPKKPEVKFLRLLKTAPCGRCFLRFASYISPLLVIFYSIEPVACQ
jgi:hypothetical protein